MPFACVLPIVVICLTRTLQGLMESWEWPESRLEEEDAEDVEEMETRDWLDRGWCGGEQLGETLEEDTEAPRGGDSLGNVL